MCTMPSDEFGLQACTKHKVRGHRLVVLAIGLSAARQGRELCTAVDQRRLEIAD